MSSPFPYVQVAGENSAVIYFGADASAEISAKVQQCADLIASELGAALIDVVPSYASLLVIYNAFEIDHLAVNKALRKILSNLAEVKISDGKVVLLPVYYSTESGPDLALLANNAGLSVDDVIAIHQSQEYRVYAIGFAPGFAYLGEVDKRIAAARLATPRQKVPRGAVGIADRQTAVYPAVSPGGWNLIGLCPQRMFDPSASPTMPVAVGDRVKFAAISRDEFLALGGAL
ncbi:MAG: KipI family sensor histidine kinase inhibitor [Porticoccus sp.]|jgi:KipI family sensor histidine kinase inhibitor